MEKLFCVIKIDVCIDFKIVFRFGKGKDYDWVGG